MRPRRWLPFVVLAAGCATQGWHAEDWARARPELAGRDVGRLGDATPYLVAADDMLHLFLCRWRLDAPLRVSLPRGLAPEERRVLEVALAAWSRAVPGLRFAPTDGEAPLRIRFRDDGEAARTAALCRVEPPFGGDGPLHASLVDALVELRRSERDAWGRPRTLDAVELLGAAAHELGHALGLQGHATSGTSALRREPSAVRRLGERLLAGGRLHEPAMAALYRVPSGSRVERRPLHRGATARLDALARVARERGAEAALLQLGDRALRVAWGSDPEFVYYLRDAAQLVAGKIGFDTALILSPATAR